MFYRPGQDDHGLPHNPFKAIVSPRPIAWVSTVDKQGLCNLAPFSYFNALNDRPPMVMFCPNGTKPDTAEGKDTRANILETGEFVINIVAYGMRQSMNISSGHYDSAVDEFDRAGLEKGESQTVAPPYVVGAPAVLECVLYKEIELPGQAYLMIGEVKGIHLKDACIVNGEFDVTTYNPLARLGYRDYSAVREVFALARPGQE